MAAATRKCKVCGCEYEYCHTARRVAGVFRWQDVACCAEHGSIYLEQIIKSRSQDCSSDSSYETTEDNPSESVEVLDDEENDDLFEEEFDDDEDELAIETM